MILQIVTDMIFQIDSDRHDLTDCDRNRHDKLMVTSMTSFSQYIFVAMCQVKYTGIWNEAWCREHS